MRSDRRIVWAPASRIDLLSAWRYHADATSANIADRVLRDIRDAALKLNRVLTPGRPRDELIAGLRSAYARPYTIFFRLREGSIEIVRVLHERQQIEDAFDENGGR